MSLINQDETYKIIGKCFDVHNNLGAGFLEIVYKDALEFEFRESGIVFAREVEYPVNYKGTILPHKFYADFVVFDKIILEVKALSKGFTDAHIAQAINYLKVSENKIALLVNFGEETLKHKRLIY